MNTTTDDGILIAGGGLASQRSAEMLRRCGYEGRIRMLCGESHAPYDRPPLSKGVLRGDDSEDSLRYRPDDWYERNEIELLLGVASTELLPAERRVRLADGSVLRYRKLLIATGSRPRTLPLLARYENVSVLRSIEDSRLLRAALSESSHVAVVGAGFIGQEVAATARRLGVEVTMIEAAEAPLIGILGSRMGEWFAEMHRSEGVEVLTGTVVDGALGNGTVRVLELSDGRRLEVDHVIVGVGVQADVAWLQDSGLAAPFGVPVDRDGRTVDQHVFAAGDVAATYQPLLDQHVPGSHWEAAGRQGARAARAMLGLDPGAAPVTSFWTDQYGIRIQYLGHARLADDLSIDGDPGSRDFTVTFTREGRAVAALLVGRPRHLPAARQLIQNGANK